MSNEKELRKTVRNEIRTVLKEDNVIVKVLTKILDNLHGRAKKKALKRFISTPEVQKLIQSEKPASEKFEKGLQSMLKKYVD